MKYCKNCLEPSTRPTTSFDKNGICLSCISFEKNRKLFDENHRLDVLTELLKKYKRHNSSKFDCVIGVSGGKDSIRQALWVREKLKLRPLLVCGAYPPEQITEVGAKNLSNLIDQGFDLVVSAAAPNFWRKTMKKGFFDGNYLRGPEIFLHASQVQIAIKYGIKLIFWGENPASVWNDTKTKSKNKYYGNALRNSNKLKNCDLDCMRDFQRINKLIPASYPNQKEFNKHNIKIIYLGWFWDDWSVIKNAKVSATYGLSEKIMFQILVIFMV